MYEYLRGKLISLKEGKVVVEIGGIGYRIAMPVSAYRDLPALGSEVKIFVTFVVREDAHSVYGFLGEGDRTLFETFLGVSGVGPKLALALLGYLSFNTLHRAIAQGDIKTMQTIPGVGKKTAERLILEVKDRLPQLFPREMESPRTPQDEKVRDATAALVNLGYQQSQAKQAVLAGLEAHGEEVDLSELITAALRH